MSDQTAKSASTSDAKYWKHELITMGEQEAFLIALDEAVADGFEIAAYSCTGIKEGLVYSALVRRRPHGDEIAEIERLRVQRFEESLDDDQI